MKIRIGARQSDLARLQAVTVGDALKKSDSSLEVEYIFKTSLGDQNQNDPLWKMPEKGVFTQDLTLDLISGVIDLVVHSWKDLPTEVNPKTCIAATLPRQDSRDLLLFKRKNISDLSKNKNVTILSSSPRRVYNLTPFLEWALPFGHNKIQFKDIRGNIPTRIKKFLADNEAQGLVLAKAALDRLLSTSQEEFLPIKKQIQDDLKKLNFMVLPLKDCPPAAAQGALAIECLKSRNELHMFLNKINCKTTFRNVENERKFLASYGGGCHQKIGVSYFDHKLSYLNGQIKSAKGKTDSGEVLNFWHFTNQQIVNGELTDFFPKIKSDAKFFKTKPIDIDQTKFRNQNFLWVAKYDAWPKFLRPETERIIWTSGQDTWRKLARDGHWVSGCSEGLGDDLTANLDLLIGKKVDWLRLTHLGAVEHSNQSVLATYTLEPLPDFSVNIDSVSHFFWMSASSFEEALKRWPKIKSAWHACGAGKSADLIAKALGPNAKLQCFVTYEEWRDRLPRKK